MTKFMIILALMVAVALPSSADEATWTTKVRRVVVHDTNFSGCMAYLGRGPADLGLNCNGKWIALGCDGSEASKAVGAAKLSAAQLSLVTDSEVYVQVTDDVFFNNRYCYATRIDNIQ